MFHSKILTKDDGHINHQSNIGVSFFMKKRHEEKEEEMEEEFER